MFLKVILFATLVAVSLAFPQHSHAISHQTLHISEPVAHAIAAPAVAYHAAPAVAYHAAPVIHAAPAFAYHAAPAFTYHAPAVAVKAAPVAVKAVVAEPYAPPHYEFEYAVHDPHTGDIKEQKESRKDDVVQGYYSLHEPDGTKRTVHYTADKHNGFNAVVHREGKAVHAQPVAKVAAVPVIKSAPIISYAAPISHGYSSHY